jgi:PAS domain S-box-containing protein
MARISYLYPLSVCYLVAIIATGGLLVLRLTFLNEILGTDVPFILFFIAITLSAWCGGLKPGLLATVISALVTQYYFTEPLHSLKITSLENVIQQGLFLLVGLSISLLCEALHRVRSRLDIKKQHLQNTLDKLNQKEQAIKVSEERYRSFIQQSSEGIWRFELDKPIDTRLTIDGQIDAIYQFGYLAECNDAFAQMYGYNTASDIIGTQINDLLPRTDQRNVEFLRAFIQNDYRLENAESNKVDNEGKAFYILNNFVGIREGNYLVHAWGIQRDITEKRQYEDMLIEARNAADAANQAKSEFLANMSHEIRTPMNSVIASTELLLGTALTKEQQEYAHIIYQGGEILVSLINDILDFSKIEAGEMELHPTPFNITTLMEEIIFIFKSRAQPSNVTLTLEKDEDIPSTIVGDSKRLRQIIFNLVSNAVKFTEKGTITLKIKKLDENNDHTTLRFEVEDTGIGIAPDKIKGIFGKFIQADSSSDKKYGGTGLGLAISKQLTELMGGTISATSEFGKGSCFVVQIPFILATASEFASVRAEEKEKFSRQVQSVSSEPQISQIHAKVLLVEDYPPNQKVAQKMLEKIGCTVEIASDGEQALQKLHEQYYDIVLMDCQMPEMDGFETTRLIRQDKDLADNIIIAMTANALEGDREKCIAAGMNDYIAKPIRFKEVETVLHKYLPPTNSMKTQITYQ